MKLKKIVDQEPERKAIGFQVVSSLDSNIHPYMVSSFCIYNFEQACRMIGKDVDKWYLLVIYEGDISKPKFMF
jgi:hypothetical protein